MGTHAGELWHHHRLLMLAILIATIMLLHTHAGGQPIASDPARGPYDDRVPMPALEWTVASGEQAAPIFPALAGSLSTVATLGGGVTMALASVEEQPRLAAVGVTAFVLGPSLGHLYGGRVWNDGLAARLGGALAGGAGLVLALGCIESETLDTCDVGGDAVLLGTTAYLVGAVYEIITAPASVHTAQAKRARISVVPVRGLDQIVPGLALARRF